MASEQALTNGIPLQDRAEVLRRLAPLLHACGGRLLLFGSRARGDARPASDIDLAVHATDPIPAHWLASARESLEDSAVPFRIDLLDYATLSSEMRQAIDKEAVAWTD